MSWVEAVGAATKPLQPKNIRQIYSRLGITTIDDQDGIPRPAHPDQLAASKEGGTDGPIGDASQFLDLFLPSDYRKSEGDRDRDYRYGKYQLMDSSMTEASMTLDAYSDEAVGMGFSESILEIKVKGDSGLQQKLRQVLDENDFLQSIRGLIRAMCKWGDVGVEVARIGENLHLSAVPPTEWRALSFPDTGRVFEYHLRGKEKSASIRPGTATREDADPSLRGLHQFTAFTLFDREFAPYGRSILEPMRLAADQLMTIEALLALTRASRVERMIMRLPVDTTDPTQAFYKLKQAQSLVKNLIVSSRDGKHSAQGRIPSLTDWLIFPSDKGFEMDRLSSGLDISSIDDIEYFRDEVLLASGLPKAYFTADEISNRGMAMLAQDLKFARKVIPVQNSLVRGLTRLCLILAAHFPEVDPEKVDIRVEMKLPVQINTELVSSWGDVVSAVTSIVDAYKEFSGSPEDEEGRPLPVLSQETYFTLLKEVGLPHHFVDLLLKGRIKREAPGGEEEAQEERRGEREGGWRARARDGKMGRDPEPITFRPSGGAIRPPVGGPLPLMEGREGTRREERGDGSSFLPGETVIARSSSLLERKGDPELARSLREARSAGLGDPRSDFFGRRAPVPASRERIVRSLREEVRKELSAPSSRESSLEDIGWY